MSEEVRFGHKSPRRWSEDECIAKQSRGLNVWSAIQGNVPGCFIDKDKHPGNTRQRKAI